MQKSMLQIYETYSVLCFSLNKSELKILPVLILKVLLYLHDSLQRLTF